MATSGPVARAATPLQNENACQPGPRRPSVRNTSALTMPAAGSAMAWGVLVSECRRPVTETSTQPGSHGKNPTATMNVPATTSRAVTTTVRRT
jgi:hypothetical protein